MTSKLRRFVRAVGILVRDDRIPGPLRGLAAVGLLPIPGPVDELVLLVVGGLLWVFHRDRLREAWAESGARSGIA